MKHRLIWLAVTIASWLVPQQSAAQGMDIGLSGVGLLSYQPVNKDYVGGPYLSDGMGGNGPGFGVAVSGIASNGFVFASELTTARYKKELYGRLIGGCGISSPCNTHITTLHDSILSGLIGYTRTSGNTRAQLLGGIGTLLDSPAIDGESGDWEWSWVFIGGYEVLQSLNPRTALVFGARYTYKTEDHPYLGIGPHIFRFSAGVRVKVN
jgi:hypothetical protein